MGAVWNKWFLLVSSSKVNAIKTLENELLWARRTEDDSDFAVSSLQHRETRVPRSISVLGVEIAQWRGFQSYSESKWERNKVSRSSLCSDFKIVDRQKAGPISKHRVLCGDQEWSSNGYHQQMQAEVYNEWWMSLMQHHKRCNFTVEDQHGDSAQTKVGMRTSKTH